MAFTEQFRILVGDVKAVPLQTNDDEVQSATLVARVASEGCVHLCAILTNQTEDGPRLKRARSSSGSARARREQIAAYGLTLTDDGLMKIVSDNWGLDTTIPALSPELFDALGLKRKNASPANAPHASSVSSALTAGASSSTGSADQSSAQSAPMPLRATVSLIKPTTSASGVKLSFSFAGDSFDLLLPPLLDSATLCETVKLESDGEQPVPHRLTLTSTRIQMSAGRADSPIAIRAFVYTFVCPMQLSSG